MRPYYNNYSGGGGYTFGNDYMTPGVKWLMGANLAVFVIQVIVTAFGNPFVMEKYLALWPHKVVENFWVWQLVTSIFLHAVQSIFHIIFNLLTLFFFGHLVERHYGTKRFLIGYLFCGILASLIYTVFEYARGTQGHALGASGALMGVLMIASCLHPNLSVYLYFLVPIRMRTLIWIIIGLNFYTVLIVTNSGVAAMSHLGGLLAGYIFYRYGDRFFHYWQSLEKNITTEYHEMQKKKKRVVREEVDRILDKINREGLNSLTEREREFLKEASREYQKD